MKPKNPRKVFAKPKPRPPVTPKPPTKNVGAENRAKANQMKSGPGAKPLPKLKNVGAENRAKAPKPPTKQKPPPERKVTRLITNHASRKNPRQSLTQK